MHLFAEPREPMHEFVGFYAPLSLTTQLETLARTEGRNKSEVVRRLLEIALQNVK